MLHRAAGCPGGLTIFSGGCYKRRGPRERHGGRSASARNSRLPDVQDRGHPDPGWERPGLSILPPTLPDRRRHPGHARGGGDRPARGSSLSPAKRREPRVDRARASELAARFPEIPLLVVGDLMIDRYLWGSVSRISPEAPVPVVRGLVVSDSAKGGISADLLASVLPEAARRRLPVVVDPKVRLFPHYRPATVVTPNTREAMEAAGLPARTEEEFDVLGRRLLHLLDSPHVLITRGERGMLLVGGD